MNGHHVVSNTPLN